MPTHARLESLLSGDSRPAGSFITLYASELYLSSNYVESTPHTGGIRAETHNKNAFLWRTGFVRRHHIFDYHIDANHGTMDHVQRDKHISNLEALLSYRVMPGAYKT